jgi:dihydrofolate synthase/folylpolyglutamate synthase
MIAADASLSDWLAWLETLSPTEINLGLDRVQELLARLNLTPPDHVLLIAGTNGKGSSVHMTDALLGAAGFRTGAYTSPHVSRYNERIAVAGKTASDAEIIAAFRTVNALREDIELTYFEFGTLAAAVIFAAAKLDVWILEVGLGGRLDATNAIEPTASLITNISLDHCDWLGNDVETIAIEKAGVMRAEIPTVYGDASVPDTILRQAKASGAQLLRAGVDYDLDVLADGQWNWRGPSESFNSLQPPGLSGDFQIANAAAVLALLDAAGLMTGIDANLINQVLPGLSLAGRSQKLTVPGLGSDSNEWLIDVAHNPAAAQFLAESLAALDNPAKRIAIVGVLDDKDIGGIIGPLTDHVDQWIAITADSHRAVPSDELAGQIANLTGRACLIAGSIEDATEFARRESSENDRILVTGSFFTVAPVLDQLKSICK